MKKMIPHEIEQKYRISDPLPVRRRLRELQAKKRASGHETNVLYDLKGLLRGQGCVLRLRRYAGKTLLTFKGPRKKSDAKTRVELEAVVPERAARNLLARMGLQAVFAYEKNREVYACQRSVVTIDELPGLGWFVEVEAESARDIKKTAALLGLSASQIEERTYVQLLRSRGRRRGRKS